jgi:hypothetical protein
MDLSRFSDSDLRALSKNNLRDVSDAGLKLLAAEENTPRVKQDTGFTGAFKSGIENLKADIERVKGKTGIKDVAEAEKSAAEYERKAGQIFKPTEEGWTEAPFQKFKETLGGSLPYMAAPVVAGGAAALAGAPIAVGTGLAGLASLTQFTGSNLGRQMQGDETEGVAPKSLAETSLGKSVAGAIPQTALDMVSLRMIPGIGKIFGAAGKKITPEMAKQVAEQGIAKTAGAYGAQAIKTGGIEGVTEAGQQVLERLQAGLSITNEKARDEYFDSFLGGALLGGPLALPGTALRRGEIKSEGARLQREKEAKQVQEEQAAAQQEALAKQAEEQQLALQQRQQETGDLFGEAPLQTGVTGKKVVEGAVSPLANQPEIFQTGVNEKNEPIYGARQNAPDTRTVAEREAEANKPPEITPQEIFSQHDALKSHVDDLQDRMAKAAVSGDIDVLPDLSAQLSNAQKALVESNKRVKQTAPVEQTNEVQLAQLKGQIRSKTDALKKAGDLGDFDKISKLSAEIKEIQTKITGKNPYQKSP